MGLLPRPLRPRFRGYLERYGRGRGYGAVVFVCSIVFGSYQVIRRYFFGGLTVYVRTRAGTRRVALDYNYAASLHPLLRAHLYSLYVRQVLSFAATFVVPADTARTYPTDGLLRLEGRRHHCRACGRAVTKFDHHCAWISGCVAGGNQPFFAAFLLETVLINGSHAAYCAHFLWTAMAKLRGAGEGTAGLLLANFAPIVAQAVIFALISVSVAPFAM